MFIQFFCLQIVSFLLTGWPSYWYVYSLLDIKNGVDNETYLANAIVKVAERVASNFANSTEDSEVLLYIYCPKYRDRFSDVLHL
jgi:hypothetical protein